MIFNENISLLFRGWSRSRVAASPLLKDSESPKNQNAHISLSLISRMATSPSPQGAERSLALSSGAEASNLYRPRLKSIERFPPERVAHSHLLEEQSCHLPSPQVAEMPPPLSLRSRVAISPILKDQKEIRSKVAFLPLSLRSRVAASSLLKEQSGHLSPPQGAESHKKQKGLLPLLSLRNVESISLSKEICFCSLGRGKIKSI